MTGQTTWTRSQYDVIIFSSSTNAWGIGKMNDSQNIDSRSFNARWADSKRVVIDERVEDFPQGVGMNE